MLKEDILFKLDEANYFLGKMKIAELNNDLNAFRYELSACTTAARSVLQYVYKYRRKAYNKNIKSVKNKNYFTKIRNKNVHQKPITSHKGGVSIISVELEVPGRKESANNFDASPPLNEYMMVFNNGKSVVTETEKYLKEIEQFIVSINSYL